MDKLNIEIDGPKAMELLWFAVAERGVDYVYEKPQEFGVCSYVDADKAAPGCGVGLALHKAGVPVSVLAQLDNEGAIHLVACYSTTLYGLSLTKNAVAIFGEFQRIQDLAQIWGRALRAAVRVASKQTEV